ncbi:hypothetical protein [Streptomyces cahuitamycinicus]|nr:hypothetical protein [Streptomyces cahuitamycinicus]
MYAVHSGAVAAEQQRGRKFTNVEDIEIELWARSSMSGSSPAVVG